MAGIEMKSSTRFAERSAISYVCGRDTIIERQVEEDRRNDFFEVVDSVLRVGEQHHLAHRLKAGHARSALEFLVRDFKHAESDQVVKEHVQLAIVGPLVLVVYKLTELQHRYRTISITTRRQRDGCVCVCDLTVSVASIRSSTSL